jgi:hypothetical protein
MKFNELPPETLQWIINKIIAEMVEINNYQQMVDRWGLVRLHEDELLLKSKMMENLQELYGQVIQAMGDIEVNKRIMSN